MTFGRECYYAAGGMADFIGYYDDLIECLNAMKDYDWQQIYDLEKKEIVFMFNAAHGYSAANSLPINMYSNNILYDPLNILGK